MQSPLTHSSQDSHTSSFDANAPSPPHPHQPKLPLDARKGENSGTISERTLPFQQPEPELLLVELITHYISDRNLPFCSYVKDLL